ncbi:MAG: hypothetical protein LC778_12505 [Acidobacteria bacterium]|nr:hypothetical protein [Acidobacteriota bacterium]
MNKESNEPTIKIKREIKGVVEPKLVRIISFIIITLSLVACTVLCILAIWQFTESDAVWRAVATFIVVSVATGIFTFVNEKLG